MTLLYRTFVLESRDSGWVIVGDHGFSWYQTLSQVVQGIDQAYDYFY